MAALRAPPPAPAHFVVWMLPPRRTFPRSARLAARSVLARSSACRASGVVQPGGLPNNPRAAVGPPPVVRPPPALRQGVGRKLVNGSRPPGGAGRRARTRTTRDVGRAVVSAALPSRTRSSSPPYDLPKEEARDRAAPRRTVPPLLIARACRSPPSLSLSQVSRTLSSASADDLETRAAPTVSAPPPMATPPPPRTMSKRLSRMFAGSSGSLRGSRAASRGASPSIGE